MSALISSLYGQYLRCARSVTYQNQFFYHLESTLFADSALLENFYIPPIIFNTQQVDMSGDSSKKEDLRWKRVCVDGKQRLLSIRAFTRGEIPVSDAQGRRW